MYTTQGWTNDTLQNQNIILPWDGTSVSLTLQYLPQAYGWYIQNLTYGNFVLNSLRLTTNPNVLQQFCNQLPFGLAFLTTDSRESTQQGDLQSGYATLYLMSAAEVAQYTEFLSGQT